MATIKFDDHLDAELEKAVPPTYRGERKTAIRADYVAREWLRDRAAERAEATSQRDDSPASAA